MWGAAGEGARYAILAYSAWGLFPLYWKLLYDVPALTVLLHRIFWCILFYSGLRVYGSGKNAFRFRLSAKEWPGVFAAAIFIGTNWLLYIWAVNAGHIVETSLGYFINPLINILLGIVFFKEKLLRHQKVAVLLALIGVSVLTWEAGRIPWIALSLAMTFSLYGFLRKRIDVGSIEGGQLESLLILVPVFAAALFLGKPLVPDRNVDWIFLIASGVVTGLPLIWFVEAAKRLPYYLLGFFQYLAPTLQFFTGVVIFHEPLSSWKFVGFAFIWSGIAWLLWKTLRRARPIP
ncbi:MAG TPA: EamA family transporter RarD [Pseudobdellovibrionaceae bacterium]|nr:EamA family transporter RarD [Pseudobdellovibrionaceae bacterium]